jgi:hypothetical protein
VPDHVRVGIIPDQAYFPERIASFATRVTSLADISGCKSYVGTFGLGGRALFAGKGFLAIIVKEERHVRILPFAQRN